MKQQLKVASLLGATVLVVGMSAACERFQRPDNEQSASTWGDDESHYFGNNCMDCHYTEGRGEGWFTVAGSASGSNHGATVEITSGPQGTGDLIRSVEIDALGNFYTTQSTDFKEGVYVGLRSPNGNIEYMDGYILNGQCNLCHGTEIDGPLVIE